MRVEPENTEQGIRVKYMDKNKNPTNIEEKQTNTLTYLPYRIHFVFSQIFTVLLCIITRILFKASF